MATDLTDDSTVVRSKLRASSPLFLSFILFFISRFLLLSATFLICLPPLHVENNNWVYALQEENRLFLSSYITNHSTKATLLQKYKLNPSYLSRSYIYFADRNKNLMNYEQNNIYLYPWDCLNLQYYPTHIYQLD